MKKQKGRKALIILSNGVDHGSKETLDEAIMTAQRADTVVYSILFAEGHLEVRDAAAGRQKMPRILAESLIAHTNYSWQTTAQQFRWTFLQ